jgi:transketolase C-terminal domain/subunit
LIERPFEQIKLDIDSQDLNVKLVGFADYPQQGPTHNCLDESGLMGLLNNTKSYFPKDSQQTREILINTYHDSHPAFISLKKDKEKR